MLAAKFLPLIRNSLHQIVPPVIATLLAAVLIAGYNRAFSGHMMQPRLAAVTGKIGMPDDAAAPSAPAQPRETAVAITGPEPVVHERIFAKGDEREAGKDATPVKLAAAVAVPNAAPAEPAAAPAAPVRAPRKAEPRVIERRAIEPQSVPVPVIVAPPPVIAAAPIVVAQPTMQPPLAQDPQAIAAKPMVTVPDRPRTALPPYPSAPEQYVGAPPPPQGGALERFVDTLRPSTIFSRMRQFGEQIEAAGNDILPNVRPQ